MHDDVKDWQPQYRAWIERICQQHKVTPTEISRRIGASPSTVTRQIKEGWTRRPSLDVLRRISTTFHSPIPQHLIGVAASAPGFGEPDVAPLPFDTEEDGGFDPNLSDWEVRSGALAALGCMPGDTLRFDARIQPVAEDIVIAQVYKAGQLGAETVMRFYLPPYLLAAELGSPSIKPIALDPDGERVRIVGVMVKRWRLRKTQGAAAA